MKCLTSKINKNHVNWLEKFVFVLFFWKLNTAALGVAIGLIAISALAGTSTYFQSKIIKHQKSANLKCFELFCCLRILFLIIFCNLDFFMKFLFPRNWKMKYPEKIQNAKMIKNKIHKQKMIQNTSNLHFFGVLSFCFDNPVPPSPVASELHCVWGQKPAKQSHPPFKPYETKSNNIKLDINQKCNFTAYKW